MNLGRVEDSWGNSVTFSYFPLSVIQPNAMKEDNIDDQTDDIRLCFWVECQANKVWPVGSGCAGPIENGDTYGI